MEISDFITTSPPFLLESPKKLHFYHWQGSAQTTLKICVNFVCPWRFNHIARDWAKEEIHLDPDAISLACNKATAEKCGTVDNARSFTRTTSQLMFIAEGVKKFHYLAIDQIRITES